MAISQKTVKRRVGGQNALQRIPVAEKGCVTLFAEDGLGVAR